MKNRERKVLIVSIIALVLVLIGVTYAYFSARITGLESASTISLTAGRMAIQYSEGDENVIMNNIYPRSEEWVTKTITLTGWNTTDQNMSYNLNLNVITNTFPNNYLTYDLTVLQSTNGTPVSAKTGVVINGTGEILIGKGTFTQANGDVHRYELKIYFKDNGLDQNDAQEAVFNAKINIGEKKVIVNDCIAYAYDIVSYDINYDTCMDLIVDGGYSQSEGETYCTGGEVDLGNELWSIESDIQNGLMNYLINEGVIDNAVYENPTLPTLNSGYLYVNGQYIYIFGEYGGASGWQIQANTYDSTEPITTPFCTSVNGYPILSLNSLYSFTDASYVDLSTLDSSQVVDMSYMFRGLDVSDIDLSNLDTSNVTNMVGMFSSASGTDLDFSSFDTSNVTTMQSMFNGATFDSLNMSNVDTSHVTNMNSMFVGADIDDLDLSGLDTTSVTTMDFMFESSKISNIDVSNFDTSHVTSMRYMFSRSKALTLDLRSFDTSSVTDMNHMFYYADATSIDVSSFDTSHVSKLSFMFSAAKVTNLDLRNFDTSNVTEMSGMFYDSALVNLDVTSFDTSNVTRMDSMFKGIPATELDLRSFNTVNTRNFSNMFENCTNLRTIYTSSAFENSYYIKPNISGTVVDNMFLNDTNLVGGAGTVYDSSKVNNKYAHIDGVHDSYYSYRGNSYNGYFTDYRQKPTS